MRKFSQRVKIHALAQIVRIKTDETNGHRASTSEFMQIALAVARILSCTKRQRDAIGLTTIQ